MCFWSSQSPIPPCPFFLPLPWIPFSVQGYIFVICCYLGPIHFNGIVYRSVGKRLVPGAWAPHWSSCLSLCIHSYLYKESGRAPWTSSSPMKEHNRLSLLQVSGRWSQFLWVQGCISHRMPGSQSSIHTSVLLPLTLNSFWFPFSPCFWRDGEDVATPLMAKNSLIMYSLYFESLRSLLLTRADSSTSLWTQTQLIRGQSDSDVLNVLNGPFSKTTVIALSLARLGT